MKRRLDATVRVKISAADGRYVPIAEVLVSIGPVIPGKVECCGLAFVMDRPCLNCPLLESI